MRKFFAFIIRQSVAVVLITLFILGFGVWSTVNMSVNLLPDINVPVVCVQPFTRAPTLLPLKRT